MADVLWTVERVELLRKLVLKGSSASEIANELACGATRNAVIGKVSRLGMTLRGSRQDLGLPQRPAVQPRKIRVAPSPTGGDRPPAPRPRPAASFVAPADDPIVMPPSPDDASPSVLDVVGALRAVDCRWPVGDPRQPGFRFCCSPRNEGRPYCAAHEGVAYDRSAKF